MSTCSVSSRTRTTRTEPYAGTGASRPGSTRSSSPSGTPCSASKAPTLTARLRASRCTSDPPMVTGRARWMATRRPGARAASSGGCTMSAGYTATPEVARASPTVGAAARRVVGAPPSTSEKGTARRTTALPGRPACSGRISTRSSSARRIPAAARSSSIRSLPAPGAARRAFPSTSTSIQSDPSLPAGRKRASVTSSGGSAGNGRGATAPPRTTAPHIESSSALPAAQASRGRFPRNGAARWGAASSPAGRAPAAGPVWRGSSPRPALA